MLGGGRLNALHTLLFEDSVNSFDAFAAAEPKLERHTVTRLEGRGPGSGARSEVGEQA
jgi:hypothetical protein